MLVTSISFPSCLEDIMDIEDDNIDVFVELEDGYTCTVVVATAKNLVSLMDKERMNYFEPGHPFIIVKKLTEEIIEEAVRAYAEDDAHYLKFYSAELDTKTLDVLKARYIARDKLLDDLMEKGESIDIENFDLIDFNIDNL